MLFRSSPLLRLGLCAAVLAGALHATADFAETSAPEDVRTAARLLAANVLLAEVAMLVLAALLAAARARLPDRWREGAFACLALLIGFAPVAATRETLGALAVSVVCVGLAGACGGLALATARLSRAQQLDRLVFGAGPWLALATAAALWIHFRYIGGWSDPAGLAALLAWLAAAAIAASWAVASPAGVERSALFAPAAIAALAALSVWPAAPTTRVAAAPAASACGVLLTVDTLRADALRAFEPAAEPHPQLDALLAESVVFRQARSAAPWTKPAFASMFTGLPLGAHGVLSFEAQLPEWVETLAERARAAGLATAAVGDNPLLGPRHGFAQGFDTYEMFPKPWHGNSWAARLARWSGLYEGGASSARLADLAIERLDRLGAGPFFLWVHFLDPHVPYEPPAGYRPEGEAPAAVGYAWSDTRGVRSGFSRLTGAEKRWLKALYDGEVRYVDANVGRILAALRERGLYDRCVIALASDHGEEFWEHGQFSHGQALYDESIRVPLAFRVPGSRAGAAVDASVSNQSLAPTLLDLLGLSADGMDVYAPSLAPLVRDPTAEFRERPVIVSGMLLADDTVAVVQGGRKTIEDVETARALVFDLAADPRERAPLADPGDTLAAARAAVSAWRAARPAAAAEGSGARVDAETERRLRELGYVE